MKQDTIAAIASGMTQSGIGIIRISGDDALMIADRVFKSADKKCKLQDVPSHTIHYGFIYDDGRMIDEVLVSVMRAPRTYTRENTVEINCHGGILTMKKTLEAVLSHGARLAEPGEFTKRAFLSGRVDLSQAEAVIDVINARNTMALDSSLKHLRGGMKKKIEDIRHDMLGNVAAIESALDDPEHLSLDNYGETLSVYVSRYMKELNHLLETSENGRLIKEGIQTAIIGKPNAGKSSLMNLLLGTDRAIVTEIAGTTRDTLEESLMIGGIPLQIIDTAGIRDTEDIVEKIGVDKARKMADESDLVLFVVDGSVPLDENDLKVMQLITDKKVIIILNKSDLETKVSREDIHRYIDKPIVEISARTGQGLDELEGTITEMFFSANISMNEEIFVTNTRHRQAIIAAIESLKQVMISIENDMPEDFFSIDLMDACSHLGLITGASVQEDLVNRIFSEFCMGK